PEELAPVLVRSLPALTLGLYPATARPGSIDGVLSLRDDPLKALALALGHEGDGVAETLAEPDQTALDAGQQRLEPRSALHEWVASNVAALYLHQIEGVDAQRRLLDRKQ